MFDFGLRIRELRRKHHMSQEELGRRVERSKSVISSYENNLKIPPLDILTEMARIFHVSLDYLVGIDKAEMISVQDLTVQQKKLVQMIVSELHENVHAPDGLTQRQQEIFGGLMNEFSKPSKNA